MAGETGAEIIDRYEAMLRLNVAYTLGNIIVGGSHFGSLHYVDLSPDADATIYNFGVSSPFYTEARVLAGLHLNGVLRRQGIRRQLAEANPGDINRGDKLVLEYPTGGTLITPGINRFYDIGKRAVDGVPTY